LNETAREFIAFSIGITSLFRQTRVGGIDDVMH
jgi:hypothetical protein